VSRAPSLIRKQWEVAPDRAVRDQRMAAEIRREDRLAVRARGGIVHRVKAGALPGGGVAFDDERAAVGRVTIVMRNESAVLVLAEGERQALERLARAVPH